MNTYQALLVLAIVAHAWTPRIVGPPMALGVIAWLLHLLVIGLALFALVRTGGGSP